MRSEAHEVVEFSALAELQRKAQALADHLRAAQDAASAAEGRDPTGRVLVTLDAGARVKRVYLERDWRRSLLPAELGNAVLTAYQRAVEQHLTLWTAAIARPMDTDHTSSGTHQPVATTASAPAHLDLESVADTWYRLRELSPHLDQMGRTVAGRAATTATTQDRRRNVTVQMVDARVRSVHFDQRWLARAGSIEIGEFTTEAVAAGYALHDNRASDAAGRFGRSIDIDPIRALASIGFSLPASL